MDTLNGLLEEEAGYLAGAERHGRTAGRCGRGPTASSGEIAVHMPKPKGARSAAAIIERCRRRETSAREAHTETRRRRLPRGRRRRGGPRGARGVLAGVSLAAQVPRAARREYARRRQGLRDGRLDSRGLPEAAYQRCAARSCRNVLAEAPKSEGPGAAAVPEAAHATGSRDASEAKALGAASELEASKLGEAAKVVSEGHAETLAHTKLPAARWRRIRADSAVERLNGEVRRRTGRWAPSPTGDPPHACGHQAQARRRERAGRPSLSGRDAAAEAHREAGL